jgi:propanol-preferring alcohol dehydrogenase
MTMPAVRFTGPGTRPALAEVPVPTPGPGEVRVRVRACGICGSDVHIVHGVTPAATPLTLGHEPSGVVDDPGDSAWAAGARVAIAAGYGCGDCALCRADRENVCPRLHIPGITRDGAQATYVVVPARALVPLPDSVDYATGAILTDAVATPFHAIRRSGIGRGETAAVYGLGGLGLHAVTILKQVVGARVVGVDPIPAARERALAFGADEVVDAATKPAQAVRELTGGGADCAYEFVGAAAVTDQAVKSLRRGGTCTVVGVTPEPLALGLPQALLVAGELRVQGSFGCSRAELVELVGLVGDGTLDVSGTITHRYALADFDAGLRTLETKEGDPIRVVVEQ